MGLSLALSAIQLTIQVVEQVLSPLRDLLLYPIPILFPLAAVPKSLEPVVSANPLTYLLERLHALLLLASYAIFARISPHFENFS